MMRRILFLIFLLGFSGGLRVFAAANLPPPVEREFRGLWVATVDNIDWPSKRTLTPKEQREELIHILNRAVEMNLNVIVLQVRPACDAIYDSKIEPWSEYITGEMGRPPIPFYDPLAFAVEEAHKRGLELHAWFNPYRARFREVKTPLARNHVTVKHPELIRPYGKLLLLDPTEPGTRAYSLSVIMDVVRRYDIDGVHFDDYFYPYPEKVGTRDLEFPDDVPWRRYQRGGGKLSRSDWRRQNVDTFIRQVGTAIKAEKPWVKFGISPFGIWQPKHPPEIAGFDAYNKLYADSRKWLADGWVDYMAPQLYWPASQKAQSFPVLLKWWAGQNVQHRILCPGIKTGDWPAINQPSRELTLQIQLTRKQPGADGNILWHSKPLLQNKGGVADALVTNLYATPALVPACPWLSKEAPAQPTVSAHETRRELKLNWKAGAGEVWRWVLQKKNGQGWTTEILPGDQSEEVMRAGAHTALPEVVVVSAVNRYGNLSPGAVLNAIP
jgi:uncharacterized lipoprotein YddW (UPF0748 family)